MNTTIKQWGLRLMSIPVLALVPLTSVVLVRVIDALLEGNRPSLSGWIAILLTLLLSAHLALEESLWTVFAPKDYPLKQLGNRLIRMTGYVILSAGLSWLLGMPIRAYNRQDLEFDSPLPPTVSVSGTWAGSWTDPRAEFTEDITLSLEQTGHEVSGQIVDAKGRRWMIVEGVVSGNQLNLFYNLEGSFRSRGATLLGTLAGGSLSGSYYGHESPSAGWSSKGSWQAVKAVE